MTPSPILSCVRKVEAVIDWLTVEFMTPGPHNAGKLKGTLGASHVTPMNPGPGEYATHFVARFQDPGPFAQVINTLRAAGVALEQGAFVRGIEIAFDLYAHDRAALAQLAAHLYRFAAKVADSENHRTYNGPDSSTYYIGNQGSDTIPADPVSQRIYAKTIDNNKQPLPPELHRARYEITLQGTGLPFSTLGEAASFKFETLAPWFKWRRLKGGLDPLQLAVAHAATQIGARRTRKLRAGGRREFDCRTMADTELNTRAHEALRALTRRSRRGMKSSDFSEPKWTACRVEKGAASNNCSFSPSPTHAADHQAIEHQGPAQDYNEELIVLLAELLEAA